MQNKSNQGQKVVSPVLNRVAKWAIFVFGFGGTGRHTSLETSEMSLPIFSQPKQFNLVPRPR